jgi:hypothetical protein
MVVHRACFSIQDVNDSAPNVTRTISVCSGGLRHSGFNILACVDSIKPYDDAIQLENK